MKKSDGWCAFCNAEKETIYHLFCDCDFSKPIWYALQRKIQSIPTHEKLVFTDEIIILGCKNPYINMIVAYTKWTLWTTRNSVVFENLWTDEGSLYDKIVRRIDNHIELINCLNREKFPQLH